MSPSPPHPDSDLVYEIAAAQAGQFLAREAAAAGYSPQLLFHHVRRGRFLRLRRGVYRLAHFPSSEQEELVTVWLWSDKAGVFSHLTALWLHELSDVLPARFHLSLPSAMRKRRLRVPDGVVLHHSDVSAVDRTWAGVVPVTSLRRTLVDCASAHLSPDLLLQATCQALHRGLVVRAELDAVELALAPYGGISE